MSTPLLRQLSGGLLSQMRADLDAIVLMEEMPLTAKSRLKIAFALDAWLLLSSFRLRQWLLAHRVPVVNRIIRAVELALFGAEISLQATLGTGVYIVHSHGVVIGGNTVLGDRVKLLGGNTFGNSQGVGMDYPTVGSDVLIGAGARILGAQSIGDRARVGANAVVLSDVPADSVAVGIPARIVALNG
jgi:serine O-acetyltransferase